MTAAERWLAAVWPVVRGRLPAPPAHVVEIVRGSLGGFVPMLRSSGYEALGVDPEHPTKRHYRRVEFEEAELVQDVDAVVASTSLHHVADPADVLDRITTTAAETVDAGLYDIKHESRFVVTDTYDTGPECLEIVGRLARHTCAVLRRLNAP